MKLINNTFHTVQFSRDFILKYSYLYKIYIKNIYFTLELKNLYNK